MENNLIARLVGTLYIVGTVAGILSVVATNSLLDDQDYLTKIASNEGQLVIGALLVLVMGIVLAMIPVVLYPLFKKYNQILAIGAIVFRGALEATVYIAIVISWLLLITTSQEFIQAGSRDTTSYQIMGTILLDAVDSVVQVGGVVFSIGALMIYYLFYISKLIPRWLSIWGLIGAPLYMIASITAMFGLSLDVLMAPLAIQEMVMAVWLIIRGFTPEAVPKHSS